MGETKQIRAVEMVRRIRDELARELVGKSDAEIVAFYRRAGDAARTSAARGRPSQMEQALGDNTVKPGTPQFRASRPPTAV